MEPATKQNTKIIEINLLSREICLFDSSGMTLKQEGMKDGAITYAPSSPVGQCLNLFLRLILLAGKKYA